MPEVITTGASTNTGTSTSTGTSVDKGGSNAGAEPRIGWAGQEDSSTGADTELDTHESGAEGATEAGDDEFGAESFDDPDLSDDGATKKELSFKEIFEQLKSADPAQVKAAEKAMKRDFFENRRYKQIPGFETPEKARQVQEKLQTFGGIDGIERSVAESAKMMEQLATGDPAILDQLEKDHAAGISKLAPHMLSKFEKLDPQGWAHSMASVFMATLNSAAPGGISALAALHGLAKAFPEAAKSAEFQRIAEVVNGVDEISKKAPEKAADSNDKLKQQEQKLAQEKNELYRERVSGRVLPVMKKTAMNAIAAQTKGRKLSEDSKKALLADVNTEYAKMAKADAGLQKNLKALLANNQTDEFLRVATANMERLMPMVAKSVWRKYTGIAGVSQSEQGQRRAEGAARTEVGGGGAVTGTIKTKTPQAADVDWSRMNSEMGKDKAFDFFTWNRRYYKKGDAKNVYSY